MNHPFFFNMNPYQSDDPGLSLDPNFTTVMLRNIPNKYTAKMLLDVLDKRFAKQYDYVYLPVDFVNHCNVGYAFINLRGYETRIKFYKHFHNQKVKDVLPGFNSKKVLKQVCEVNKAKVQGAKENIRRIRQMNMLMQRLKEHPEWVPLIFDTDGKAIALDLDGVTEAEERILERKADNNGAAAAYHGAAAAAAAATNGYPMYQQPSYHGASAWDHQQPSYNSYAAAAYHQQQQQQVFEQLMAYTQAHAAYQSALQAASYAGGGSPADPSYENRALPPTTDPYQQHGKRTSNSTAAKSPYTGSTSAGSPLETSHRYYSASKHEMGDHWYPEMASYQ